MKDSILTSVSLDKSAPADGDQKEESLNQKVLMACAVEESSNRLNVLINGWLLPSYFINKRDHQCKRPKCQFSYQHLCSTREEFEFVILGRIWISYLISPFCLSPLDAQEWGLRLLSKAHVRKSVAFSHEYKISCKSEALKCSLHSIWLDFQTSEASL